MIEESYKPLFFILDGKIVELPPQCDEIKINQIKDVSVPIMTFLPI